MVVAEVRLAAGVALEEDMVHQCMVVVEVTVHLHICLAEGMLTLTSCFWNAVGLLTVSQLPRRI